MIHGAILDRGEKSYTHLKKVFTAIGDRQSDYNWLITDAVCYTRDPDYDELFRREYCFISGRELTAFTNREDTQWSFGVLSGFRRDVPLEEILKHPLPYADGNPRFWENPLVLQHPLAEVEIVPWDSSLTLLFSRDEEIVRLFREAFPLSRDLAEDNRE